jgi:hydrogenase expression/formation protein HypD
MIDYLEKIQVIAKEIGRDVNIMEVCGGHTNTVMKYGIRDILPPNVKLMSGPGCPVCVTSQEDIDCMIELALSGVRVVTYGDMLDVPGSKMSLSQAREVGADVKVIYSTQELLEDENDKNRVFFAIGFETTTPMSAYLLSKGFCVYSSHKIMMPPMKIIAKQNKIDGYIVPGHVSCIVGARVWEELDVCQVICGFEREQIIRGIYKLLELIRDDKKEVINDYSEVVCNDGNLKAQQMIDKYFKVCDSKWRGIGVIKNSGLEPRDDNLNAKIKYADLLDNVKSFENKSCRCSEVIQGEVEPSSCRLFGVSCTPSSPMGACMVSDEGACRIAYKYTKK